MIEEQLNRIRELLEAILNKISYPSLYPPYYPYDPHQPHWVCTDTTHGTTTDAEIR